MEGRSQPLHHSSTPTPHMTPSTRRERRRCYITGEVPHRRRCRRRPERGSRTRLGRYVRLPGIPPGRRGAARRRARRWLVREGTPSEVSLLLFQLPLPVSKNEDQRTSRAQVAQAVAATSGPSTPQPSGRAHHTTALSTQPDHPPPVELGFRSTSMIRRTCWRARADWWTYGDVGGVG